MKILRVILLMLGFAGMTLGYAFVPSDDAVIQNCGCGCGKGGQWDYRDGEDQVEQKSYDHHDEEHYDDEHHAH